MHDHVKNLCVGAHNEWAKWVADHVFTIEESGDLVLNSTVAVKIAVRQSREEIERGFHLQSSLAAFSGIWTHTVFTLIPFRTPLRLF